MLIDLNREEIENLINGLNWTIGETYCPNDHIKEYDLIRKLNYFLQEYTGIEND